jgi:hypothetical protein
VQINIDERIEDLHHVLRLPAHRAFHNVRQLTVQEFSAVVCRPGAGTQMQSHLQSLHGLGWKMFS